MEAHYRTLGLEPGAALEDVRGAYKAAARKFHPDRPGGNADRFLEVQAAYEAITSPPEPEQEGGSLADLFAAMFSMAGKKRAGAAGPATIEVPVSVTDVRSGSRKRVVFEAPATCGECGGCGASDATAQVPCVLCRGMGCPLCRGRGVSVRAGSECRGCGGSGICFAERNIEVRVPRGVPDGHVVVAPGQGPMGGDVLIVVRHHLQLPASGLDLHAPLDVSLPELLCGFAKTVAPYDGCEPSTVASAGFFDIGRTTVRLKGLGLVDGASGQAGDVVLQPRLVMAETGAADAARLRKFADVFRRVFRVAPDAADATATWVGPPPPTAPPSA